MPGTYRLVGYMPKGTVSDNGSGKVRVTFAANAFSWSHADRTLTDGSWYLANTTTAQSAAITAKGGTKATGFWFDLGGVAYPSANWNTDDRVGVQAGAAINSYETLALAKAASATLDVILWGYSSTADDPMWGTGIQNTTAPFLSNIGIVDGLQTVGGFYVNGVDCSAITEQLILDNFRVACQGATTSTNANGYGAYYNGGVGQAGRGVKVSRLVVGPCYMGIRFGRATSANDCVAENCHVFSPVNKGFYMEVTPSKWVNCSVRAGEVGSGAYGFDPNGSTGTIVNCWAACDDGACFRQYGSLSSFLNCASTDNSATASTNGIGSITYDGFKWWGRNDNGYMLGQHRILTTSAVYHVGTVTADTPLKDIDGTTRSVTTPSIGPHEGTVNAFDVTWPTAGQTQSGVTFQTFAGQVLGTYSGGGSQPAAPSFSAVAPTAASGQVTVHIVAVNPTDVIYVLFRSGSGGWSEESETFKRIGSGDVTVTGLTDEDGHEFVAYAKSGGITSKYSDPCFATPTAGTTPSGLASLPLKYLEDTLAASAAFQGWVGAANPAEAKERIHPVSVATAEALVTVTGGAISAVDLVEAGYGYDAAPTVTVRGTGTGASITAAVSGGKVTGFTIVDGGTGYVAGKTEIVVAGPPMPWALIDWAPNFERAAAAGGSRRYFEQTGDLVVVLRAPVDADHDDAEASYAFMNIVGAIIEDMEELAGTAGYLSIDRLGRAQGPRRPEAAEVKVAGDFYEYWLRVGWDGQ